MEQGQCVIPTSERQKRQIALDSILLILMAAHRIGAATDTPEGSRYILISETLADQMIKTIEDYVEKGWTYLI